MGLYLGAVRSYLSTEEARLEQASRLSFGLGLGYRRADLFELGLNLDLGLGQSWDLDEDRSVFAFDLLIQPRLLLHPFEATGWSVYGGVGADMILFNLKRAGISHGGLGPSLILGLMRKTGPYSLVYLEVSGCAFNDLLAYHYEEPEEPEEGEFQEIPAEPEKVYGAWYGIYRLLLGYRLSGF